MSEQYTKPALEVVGELEEVTASAGIPRFVDVPFGTPITGGPIVGSR